MKAGKLFALVITVLAFSSCEVFQKTSNTTGGVFSLNGQWELVSSTPENTLIGSKVTVAPFIAEGKLTTLLNNSQCYRENDIKWKNIATNNSGGFLLNNMLSNCSSGTLNYQPAMITVVNTNEILLTGKNANGQDNSQTWRRVTQ